MIVETESDSLIRFTSDTIVIDNDASGGVIGFFSDFAVPSGPFSGAAFNNNEGQLCMENQIGFPPTGCTGNFILTTADGTQITVTAGSGFSGADPFGSGLVVDDGIGFAGATALPEPSFTLLVSILLASMAGLAYTRSRFASNRQAP